MPIHPDDYLAAGGQFDSSDFVIGADDPQAYRGALDMGFADSLGSSGSLDRDSSGVDLSVLGLGAGNVNMAPQGQHPNVELPGKLTAVKAIDGKLSSLLQSISASLTANQALLLAAPQTSGLVSVAQNAITDLQNAQSELESSFWNGTNFNSFQGSSDAWNLMDQAGAAASTKLQSYATLPSQLAAGVATAQQVQTKAQADAAAALLAQQKQTAAELANVTNAQRHVKAVILQAQNQAALDNFPQALSMLADPGVVGDADLGGMGPDLANAQSSIASQRQIADVTASQMQAASDKAAAQLQAQQQAQTLAQQQASADAAAAREAAAAQGQLQLQLEQMREAEHQADADRAAQATSFQQAIQSLAALAPLLGDKAGALAGVAIAEELGIDPATLGAIAGGGAPGPVDPASGEPYVSGFGPESF